MISWIDTHTHIYMPESREEQDACMERCLQAGVSKLLIAGVDEQSIEPIRAFCARHSAHAFPAIGLHPTDVKENYKEVLKIVEDELFSSLNANSKKTAATYADTSSSLYYAIGETGMDLYWDKTFIKEQEEVFKRQIAWARELNLPLVLHIRDAFEECWHILKEAQKGDLRGVFHCFSGSPEQAERAVDLGFHLGIGGVLTFKNAKLPEVVKRIDIRHLLLETDAPFLAPTPYRGQPNESSYLPLIGYKMAEIKGISAEEVASLTGRNAQELFGI